jgi:hypothetical protein
MVRRKINSKDNVQFGTDLVIPKDIKPMLLSLINYLINLNAKWGIYKELFYNHNNTDLLLETAPHFFLMLKLAFWNDITLGICCLADKAEYKTGSKTKYTLCLEMLVNQCSVNQIVMDSLREFRHQSESFNTLRNRFISHLDLNTMLGLTQLPKINQEEVEKALEFAGKVIQAISKQYGNEQQLIFVPFTSNGVNTLIYWLKEGKANRERIIKTLKEGHIPEGLESA